MLRHQGVHLLDVAGGQRPLPLHEVEHAFDRRLVVGDHRHDRLRIRAALVRDQGGSDPMFDEQLGDATVQGIEAFDQPSLDRPFALQPLLEVPVGFPRPQALPLFAPDMHQGAEVCGSQLRG